MNEDIELTVSPELSFSSCVLLGTSPLYLISPPYEMETMMALPRISVRS